ncbi:VOC family protein [Rhodobacter sp. Har01]|uniref:VOC family protein n=1 Tax=Rhodobacter sp. Har01 TaxID=2883999 RepID=UPI001D09764D|nr:VOC family protein [Rhodobacter sp. Har01]MCB6176523.1 VOC family protein [Rhodobacter sp. Har01]
MSAHGSPCWYELVTPDAAQAQAFYGPVLGWEFQDAGMPGFSYMLAMKTGAMVAGLMQPDAPMPCFWMVYFAVDDCDAATARVAALGGTVHRAPEDIPGTGRFAVVADPQGAAFGVLQPLPGQEGSAFDQRKEGHGNWHELQTSDSAGALAFYRDLLGWGTGQAMDMGPMGTYQIIRRGEADIGGIMRLPQPGIPPNWTPFFGVNGTNAAIDRVRAAGGTILHGPQEVPGPAFIAYFQDPQGAVFAVVGPA